MVCIYCGGTTSVANSRHQRQLNQIWRRRVCSACRAIFTTHEKVDLESALVVKGPVGHVIPFSRAILFTSLYESCKHRPNAVADAESLTQTVVATLQVQANNGSIDKQAIRNAVHDVLGRFDQAAATMYAAYHPL